MPSKLNFRLGDRFWGRETELAHLCARLREGASISLTAPRRIGKTSLMREAGAKLAAEFAVLHVDLQGAVALQLDHPGIRGREALRELLEVLPHDVPLSERGLS